MHGDLSPHLHTPECNLIIKEFHKCHEEKPVAKFFGSCNKIDKLLFRCLKKERQSKQSENLKRSTERTKVVKERLSRDKVEENNQ